MVGCECEDCVKEKSSCCGCRAGSDFAYYSKKGVRLPPGMPIFECNSKCNCGPECSNRVVQNGRKHPVCIFRTANGRGWGVKAMQKIKKGSFIMEYVGEVSKLVSLADSGTSSSIFYSPIPSPITISSSDSPLCTSITPSLFHKSYPPVVSLLPPGLPSRTFAWTISSELLGF